MPIGINLESVWCQFGVDLVSICDRSCENKVCCQSGVSLESGQFVVSLVLVWAHSGTSLWGERGGVGS